MDILRLMLLMGLLLYGAMATDRARQTIRTHNEYSLMAALVTPEDKIYIQQIAAHASVYPASIVVQDGVLVGTGLDRVVEIFDPTAHAETEAIRDACKRERKVVLKDGVLYASRQPCDMCMRVIAHSGVTKVVIVSSGNSTVRALRVPVLSR